MDKQYLEDAANLLCKGGDVNVWTQNNALVMQQDLIADSGRIEIVLSRLA